MTSLNRRSYMKGLMGVVSASALAACSSSHTTTNASVTTLAGKISVPHPVSGFQPKAVWSVKGVESHTLPVVIKGGVVFLARTTEGFTVRCVDAVRGQQQWASSAFDGGEGAPTLAATTQQGRPYLIVTTRKGNNLTVLVFDGYAVTEQSAPTSKTVVTGAADTVKVNVSGAGVLVSGASSPASCFTIDLPTGAISKYGQSPSFNGTTDGTPVAVTNGAYLIDYGGKGYVSASGTNAGAWTSSQITPTGAKAGTGRLVAAGDSTVVSSWQKQSGSGSMLVLQSETNGQTISTIDVTDDVPIDPANATSPVLAFDASVVVWGQYVFPTQKPAGFMSPAMSGFTTNMVVRSTAYGVSHAHASLVDVSSPSSKVSPTGMIGVGMTSADMGAFVDGSTLYSIPLS